MLSVIICTYNPRPDYLRRVLDALKAQTLPKEQWELLLIDNACKPPLVARWDLSWHPQARVIREEELGLTPARLRGIQEATGDLLVFVDDDNVLAADYLAAAADVAARWPQIGAFGGSIRGEFETPPPEWIAPYWEGLVVCELDRDYWTNVGAGWSRATPYGAGMCVRRRVAEDYAGKVAASSLRRMLGRAGAAMGSGEDSDLAWCAVDLGLGTGRFAALKMTHLIPAGRLTMNYVVRLNAGFAAAAEVFAAVRKSHTIPPSPAWKRNLRFFYDFVRARGVRRKILLASARERAKARRLVAASHRK